MNIIYFDNIYYNDIINRKKSSTIRKTKKLNIGELFIIKFINLETSLTAKCECVEEITLNKSLQVNSNILRTQGYNVEQKDLFLYSIEKRYGLPFNGFYHKFTTS